MPTLHIWKNIKCKDMKDSTKDNTHNRYKQWTVKTI
nr:MAG TPA: hypothetical protein [Caudoviricetes sp.]